VPFDFLKRKKAPEAVADASAQTAAGADTGIPFEGFTEDWRLVGRMLIAGRMSDGLNKREPIEIADVSWAQIDDPGRLAPAPGLKSVDPYDLIIVLASEASLPDMTVDERTAHRVHKVSYEVALEAPPYRVVGTVFLYPGSEPDTLLQRASDMFVPVVDATAWIGDLPIGTAQASAILVNRQYLRGVAQVDVRTGERHAPLPGAPMGGVNWSDRSR
jgi:hypothetical protein